METEASGNPRKGRLRPQTPKVRACVYGDEVRKVPKGQNLPDKNSQVLLLGPINSGCSKHITVSLECARSTLKSLVAVIKGQLFLKRKKNETFTGHYRHMVDITGSQSGLLNWGQLSKPLDVIVLQKVFDTTAAFLDVISSLTLCGTFRNSSLRFTFIRS